jgi:hypothetical protein
MDEGSAYVDGSQAAKVTESMFLPVQPIEINGAIRYDGNKEA